MNRSPIAALAAAACLAAGCAGVEVSSQTAPGADLASIRSWAWVEGQQLGAAGDPADRRHVVAVISDGLAEGFAKAGVAPAGGGAPDALVGFAIDLEQVARHVDYVRTRGAGYAWRGFHSMSIREVDTVYVEYALGTLVVDVVDARTGNFLWRGTAVAEFDRTAPRGDKEKAAREAAAKIAEAFAGSR